MAGSLVRQPRGLCWLNESIWSVLCKSLSSAGANCQNMDQMWEKDVTGRPANVWSCRRSMNLSEDTCMLHIKFTSPPPARCCGSGRSLGTDWKAAEMLWPLVPMLVRVPTAALHICIARTQIREKRSRSKCILQREHYKIIKLTEGVVFFFLQHTREGGGTGF